MQIWTILHILAMFIAFAFTTGVGILVAAVANSGSVSAIRTVTRVVAPFQRVGSAVLLLGVVFGMATAMTVGYGLTANWIVAGYVLVALILAIGLGVHQPWIGRLAAAAAASPDDRVSPELAAVTTERMVRIAGPVSGLLWIAVISVMVLKP
jgi:hypothetical protein